MKGGYKIKDGFYIKDDCKNNEEEGMIDENGYILDPVTFEKIPEHQIVQLSDGYCYDKQNSRQLLTVINRSNRLPFGHDVKSADRRKLKSSSSSESSINSLLSSAPISLESLPSPSTVSITSEPELSPSEIIESLSPEEILNAPQNLEIQNVPEEPALRPRRNRPRLIIESSSPEEVNVINQNQGRVHWSPDSQGNWVRRIIPTNQAQQPLVIESPEEIEIIPRRRTRRSPVRRQTRRRRPLLIIESSSPEIVAEESDPFGEVDDVPDYRHRLGQGIKRKYKKRKTKKHKKTRKTRKYLI